MDQYLSGENIFMESSEVVGNGFILSKAIVLGYAAVKERESGTDQLCCGWLSREVYEAVPQEEGQGCGSRGRYGYRETRLVPVTPMHCWLAPSGGVGEPSRPRDLSSNCAKSSVKRQSPVHVGSVRAS